MSFAKPVASVILALLFFAANLTAANKEVTPQHDIDPMARASIYAFKNVDERPTDIGSSGATAPLSSGHKSSMFVDSPGLILGHTWYDKQRNGAMRRMTRWGQHTELEIDSIEATPGCTPANPCTTSTDIFISHFHWMRLMPPIGSDRHYAYQAWVDTAGGGGSLRYPGDGNPVQSPGDWSGYVVLDVDNSNRAVLGGHNDQGGVGHFTSGIWFDRAPATGFYSSVLVPDSVQEYVSAGPTSCSGQEVIWPAMAYQEGDGTANFADTILHIVASVSDADSDCLTATQSIYYFRKVGGSDYGAGGVWDYPPYVVDTSFTLSQDIFCSKQSGKVVMAWCAARPDPGDCDTCSSNTGDNSLFNSQLDNDLYYQTSYDQGVTWQPRVNLTLREHPDSVAEDTYWPYIDLNVLIDQDDDETHFVWSGRHYVSGSGSALLACRIFHWSESQGFETSSHSQGKPRGLESVVHDAVWDQVNCNGGSWEMNASKMTISQCNSNHYVIWEQFNDIPNGIDDDCAARAFTGGGAGAANGELFVAVSSDGGVTWDEGRNITNSYSSGCTPPGGGGDPCESDVYASMSPYGYNYSGSLPANIVVPDGGSDNGWYLDVQYVNDPDAGQIPANAGTWQQADIKWMRLACVEPVPLTIPVYSFNEISFPSCAKHGEITTSRLEIENLGNVTWNFVISKYELTGPPDWLDYSGFDQSILAGFINKEHGDIILNAGGVVNSPGTIVSLRGGLVFTTVGGIPDVDTIPIVHVIADTCVGPSVDTISNSIFSLVVANNGNFGNLGAGGVNMDFVHPDSLGPDCDTTANVVLYDGSPFVMWVNGADTVANWSIFTDGWLSDRGFRPRVGTHKFESYLFECYSTGVFSTNDSSIFLEKTWYSPRNYGSNDQGFFVQCVKLWSADGLAKHNLTVGEALDWEVPSDSGADNSSGFVYTSGSPAFNLIYQQGANYSDGDTTECQNNAMRYAGVAPRGTYRNDTLLNNGNLYGAFTIDNAGYIYPNGTFSPQQLYDKITATSGYETHSSTDPDSEFVDLTTVVTNLHQLEPLGGNDTLKMYYVLASSKNTPDQGQSGEFFDWINAGIDFMNARVLYDSWTYPEHIAVDASSMTFAGDVSSGNVSGGASVVYDPVDNTTTVTGSPPIAFFEDDGLVLIDVGTIPTAFFRSRFRTAKAPDNPAGADTVIFLHEGEGLGTAKAATFSWFEGLDPAVDLVANFANPENDPNLSVYGSGFIQPTTNLSNYTGWSPEVPEGNDVGVPRTVNETIFLADNVSFKWLYVKSVTDAGGGPYADGVMIEGFVLEESCCRIVGDFNHDGSVDIADVTYIVAYAFKGGPPPLCFEEADVNGDCQIDIADISDFVAYSFKDQWWRISPQCPTTPCP